MLPNFIIPGAMKSGTTALRIYLAQHSYNKELEKFTGLNLEKWRK